MSPDLLKGWDMKSESKEIEELVESVPVVPDNTVEDVIEVRKWAVMTAMEYWDNKIEAAIETIDPIPYPAHIQTILDTAWYIEKFLMGEFKSG